MVEGDVPGGEPVPPNTPMCGSCCRRHQAGHR